MFTTYIEYVFILLRKFLSIYPELYQSLAETTIIFAAQISILTTNLKAWSFTIPLFS